MLVCVPFLFFFFVVGFSLLLCFLNRALFSLSVSLSPSFFFPVFLSLPHSLSCTLYFVSLPSLSTSFFAFSPFLSPSFSTSPSLSPSCPLFPMCWHGRSRLCGGRLSRRPRPQEETCGGLTAAGCGMDRRLTSVLVRPRRDASHRATPRLPALARR